MFQSMTNQDLRKYYDLLSDNGGLFNKELLTLWNENNVSFYFEELSFLPAEVFKAMGEECEKEILCRFLEGEL